MRIELLSAAVLMALSSNSAQAAPVLYSGNGHYYDRVATTLTFDQAVAAAAASTYDGMQGYLVTITSQAERDFVYDQFSTLSWAGGSDAEQEGVWKWITGPEAGTIFWNNGTTVTYASWAPGEPNDATVSNPNGEDALQINWSGPNWNDHSIATPTGYIIEYGTNSVPEPSTWAMMLMGFLATAGLMRRKKTLKISYS